MKIIYVYPKRFWFLRRLLGISYIEDYSIYDCVHYMVKDGMVVIDDPPFKQPCLSLYIDDNKNIGDHLFSQMSKEVFLSTVALDGADRELEDTVAICEQMYESTQGH